MEAEVAVEATKIYAISEELSRHFELLKQNQFSFVKRLSRENNWSYEFSLRVLEEYRRFILLMVFCKTGITPSDEVDQVWHLHLQYSRHYAKMGEIIGFFLHHEPTKGGTSEGLRFDLQYQETKNLYLNFFQEKPPVDIWDSHNSRFNLKPFAFRVNFKENFIIPKKSFWSIATGLVLIWISSLLILSHIFN